MKKKSSYFLCSLLLLLPAMGWTQTYDLLIRNAHMIDPKNRIDRKMDLAISKGIIAKVAPEIPASEAKKIIDASGLYLVPGLIDLHTHVFVGAAPDKFANGQNSVSPDDFTLRNGVTTVVDAGTSGWANFPLFKSQVIDQVKTRVLVFLNINATGLAGKPEEEDLNKMIVDSAVAVQQRNKEIIVGFKIGHYEGPDWAPFDRAIEAAAIAGTPLFVECHLPQYKLADQLAKMRPGDIITHSFEQITERQPVIDSSGKLQASVKAAQQKGILFDLGHGGAGFWFSQAIPAMQQGLAPNTFGSDMHRFSVNAGMKGMTNILSKYMAMGMSLQDVVLRASWNPAQAIKRPDLGNLSEGSVADICLLKSTNGKFGFIDAGGNKIEGQQKLEAELTIRAGKIVWDLNGLAAETYLPAKLK